MNEISQGAVNNIKDPSNLLILDSSIGLGFGRDKMDMDSVEDQIAHLQSRYFDVKRMQQTLVDLINNSNTSKDARKFYYADLYATKDEIEKLEDQIKQLKDAQNLDNDFKILAELKRLKKINRHVQKEIDRTNNPITKKMLREQQAKLRKRDKQIWNFREAGMWVAPNTFNTLNTTLQKRLNILADLRKKTDDRISEKEDEIIRLEEDIDDLLEEINDDGITEGEVKYNNRRIKN
jgi:uncharacterized phage infection (PIP) family protein YhgE